MTTTDESSCNFCGTGKSIEKCTRQDKTLMLCSVCRGSIAGNAAFYPTQYDNVSIMKVICACTNMILAAIEDLTKEGI
jgi:hypothetical protein